MNDERNHRTHARTAHGQRSVNTVIVRSVAGRREGNVISHGTTAAAVATDTEILFCFFSTGHGGGTLA